MFGRVLCWTYSKFSVFNLSYRFHKVEKPRFDKLYLTIIIKILCLKIVKPRFKKLLVELSTKKTQF